MKYVAQVSSLYPIDLAAALYAGATDPGVQYRIFLSDVAELPGDSRVRKYVARAALPSCSWSLDKERIWRQHHIPLEDAKGPDKLADSLAAIGRTLSGEAQVANTRIMIRCSQLAQAAISRAQRSTEKWRSYWTPFVAGIIEEIIEKVVGVQFKVEPYWPFRLGQYSDHPNYQIESRRTLDRLLHRALKAFPNRLVFVQGGHIEVEMTDGSHIWQRYSELSFDGKSIELSRPEKDRIVRLQVSPDNLHNIRFRGPLELFQLQGFGTIVDLAWYADAQFWREGNANHTGIEFISPISSSAKSRASLDAGGGGYRLYPTGYSLLEFESEVVFALIQEKLKTPPISAKDLADWLDLIHRFPPVSQKLAKDQNSVSAYRNLREVESKRRISQGDASNLQILNQQIHTLTPLLYGRHLIELLSLVALLKEWSTPACPYSVPINIIQFLELLNWVDSNSVLLPESIVSVLKAGIQATQSWLQSHGWNFTEESRNQIDDAINMLLQRGNRSLVERRDASPAGFGLILRVLRELIDIYYSFAGFCSGGLFKAHILFPFLLLGPEEYRSEINRILSLRGGVRQLFFDPILWRGE